MADRAFPQIDVPGTEKNIYHHAMSVTRQNSTSAKQHRQTEIAARLQKSARRTRLSRLLDFALPPVCIHCHKPVEGHGHLCGVCWSQIHFVAAPLCDVTGLPLPHDTQATGPRQKQISALALSHPPDYDRARSVALFGDVLRELIHGLKYRDRREGLSLFGRWMVMAGGELLDDTDLILPVPLYRARLWQRRFNQSALLSFELKRLTGIPVDVLALMRHRATRAQVGLSGRARRKNVTGAFTLKAKKRADIKDRNILLVDDVLTTGSTVDACSKTLKRAGAKRVDVLVLARAGNLDRPVP